MIYILILVLLALWLPDCIVDVWNFNIRFLLSYKSSSYLFSQGLKRLRKLQPNGRCGQVPSSECTTSEYSGSNSSPITTHSKETPDSTLRDRFAKGTTLPISIKNKKVAHEEAVSKHREHQKDDRIRHELVKGNWEPSPIEIAPKRLKIRGPSFFGVWEQVGLKDYSTSIWSIFLSLTLLTLISLMGVLTTEDKLHDLILGAATKINQL